jgi:hypothetical protein
VAQPKTPKALITNQAKLSAALATTPSAALNPLLFNLSNIALTKFPTRFVLPYNYSRRLLQLRLTAPRTSKFKMFYLCMKTLSFV